MIHPYDHLSIEFYMAAKKDRRASKEQGRPIFRDVEMFRARIAGDPTRTIVAPAHDIFLPIKAPAVRSDWTDRHDIIDDDDSDVDDKGFHTYAEAFPEHYAVFKRTTERTTIGTPIEHLPFLSKRRVAELKSRNVESVEGLASMADALLKDCGPTTRDEREQARVWLDKADQAAAVGSATAKNAELEAKLAQLQEQMAALLAKPSDPVFANDPNDPKTWDYDRLKAFATDKGVKVRANMARDKLVGAVLELTEEVAEVEEMED